MKHSKLFLTGMAALLLSFGLMMTGCDSGGDSDSDDPINADAYISIEETTPGADDPGTAAVYTVTVKQSLGGKVVTFTNVATDVVVYGPPADAEDTLAKQATAIVTKLTAADGANYDVAYTAGAESFTLTARTPGAIANAPAVAIAAYTAPAAKTSEAFTVTAGDNALKITGAVNATGTFDESAKVYVKDGGKEVLITDETSAPTGYTAPGGTVVLIADTESNKPVLWVKGLAAAVSGDAVAGKILAGADVKVVITGGAQTGDVGTVTPVSGTAVVVPANSGNAYALATDATGANTIFFTAASGMDPATVDWQTSSGGSAVGEKNLDPIFDAALIAVLSNLVATDTVKFDANGNANAVVFTVAPTADAPGAAAKLQAVLNGVGGTAPVVTLGADTTIAAGGTVTIPANKTLAIADTKSLVLTGAAGTGGAKLAGAGKLTAVFTEIVGGSGGWQVVDGSSSATITIAATGSGVTTITGSADTAILTAGAGATITQKTGSSSSLTLAATTTIDLKGVGGTPVGAIILKEGASPAVLTFPQATTGIIKTANSTNAATVSLGALGTGIGIGTTGTQTTGNLLLNATDNLTVRACGTTAATAYLVDLVSTATAAAILTALNSGSGEVTIDANFCVDANGT